MSQVRNARVITMASPITSNPALMTHTHTHTHTLARLAFTIDTDRLQINGSLEP